METNEVPIRKTKLNKISTGSIGNRNEITRKYKLHPRNYIYIYIHYTCKTYPMIIKKFFSTNLKKVKKEIVFRFLYIIILNISTNISLIKL